ncbi:MAG: type II toxin-antitoxin system VapC family toxin [Minicystis sp.]
MKYVLDTNVLSALMKGEHSAVERLKALHKDDVGVPQPALAEIAYGIARLPKSKRREALQERFELLRTELLRVEWTDDVSERFGAIKAVLEKRGERVEDFDAAIAAHAVSRGAVLATANIKHMVRVPGLVVEDWSKALGE